MNVHVCVPAHASKCHNVHLFLGTNLHSPSMAHSKIFVCSGKLNLLQATHRLIVFQYFILDFCQ